MRSAAAQVELGQGLADAIVSALSRRIVLSPSLRSVIQGLPAGKASRAQVEAVAGLVVMNVWLFCRDRAEVVLQEVEAASGGVLDVLPRAVALPLPPGAATVEPARQRAAALAARLGFSPIGRSRVMNACARLAASFDERLDGSLALEPDAQARAITLVARFDMLRPVSRAAAEGRLRGVLADVGSPGTELEFAL